ncbi:MAG: hypothetical protein U0556_08780 [Dehalococcoidia bacterium]
MTQRPEDRAGWNVRQPERVPRSAYWPAIFATGLVLVAYGFTFSGWFVALGTVLAILAAIGWIAELRHEHG